MSQILIVDDNEQNIYLVRFMLEQRGHLVEEAHNGAQALQMIEDNRYDVVLMDIQMPVMDGLEATRRIKEKPSAPIVIALTAKAMEGDKEKALAAGCDEYIAKPIEAETFIPCVERYL